MPFLLEDLIFIKRKNSCIKVINRNVLMPKEGTLTPMKKVFLLLKRNFYCFLAVFQKQSKLCFSCSLSFLVCLHAL